MKPLRLLTLVFFSILVVSCSRPTIGMKLGTNRETIPNPAFIARDMDNVGQAPYYSRIRVYKLETDCEVPQCPIVWHVVVSSTSSPTKIYYGGLPSVGATTVVGAKDLKRNTTYRMVLGQEDSVPQPEVGSITFHVNADGTVTEVAPED